MRHVKTFVALATVTIAALDEVSESVEMGAVLVLPLVLPSSAVTRERKCYEISTHRTVEAVVVGHVTQPPLHMDLRKRQEIANQLSGVMPAAAQF
jgi:glutamate racemase